MHQHHYLFMTNLLYFVPLKKGRLFITEKHPYYVGFCVSDPHRSKDVKLLYKGKEAM